MRTPTRPASRRGNLRTIGLMVMVSSVVVYGFLLVTYARFRVVEGAQGTAALVSMALGTLATLAMAAEAFDVWALGRRLAPRPRTVLHWLVTGTLLGCVLASIPGGVSGLLLAITPALVVYLFGVLERPAPRVQQGGGRQRRGGRKRS